MVQAHDADHPGFQNAIRHWRREIADSKAQIASGKYPQYDANSRRYIRECQGFIRRINEEIHQLRQDAKKKGAA